MMRGIQHICATKGALLEPYVTAIPISSHFSSKSNCSPKHKNPHNLPRLPVPKLEDTLCKYLKSVKPHLNDEELAVTTKLISDFTACGAGEKLQCILQKRAEETDNWLEDWWLNTAYLEYRDPVVVYSSPGLVFPFRRFKNQQEQIEYTAKTIVAAMDYKTLIDCDKIPLEKMGKHPLDMAQYKKIFGTCRVPGEKRDRLSYNSDSKHITVIHNNHIFHLDLWGDDDTMLSELQIANRLNKIIECSSTRNAQSVGILTSENRNAWAKAYNALSKNSKNRENLCDIEQSLAVVCLDQASGLWDTTKNRRSLAAGQCIHGGGSGGNGGNRWFDKTIQFIIGADGVTGLTYEHSPAEGQPIAVLTDFIINFIDQCKTSSTCSMSPKDPKRLDFDVDCEVSTMIEKARNNLDRLVCDLEINCFKYDKYGKGFIKSQKLSPDSYLQMAMQYAFYRLHKTPAAHYESAATRMFLGGRTETIRSCSVESVAFAKTMLDKNCSSKEKADAMKKAITAHKDYTVQALQGLGVDRHLLGLKLAAIENGIDLPKLYLDVSFKRSTHMRLSTSQVACKCDGYMAYGPLVPDGYSTCYNPREEDINFATSAFCSNKETSCEKYRDALENSLKDMHDVLVKTVCSKL